MDRKDGVLGGDRRRRVVYFLDGKKWPKWLGSTGGYIFASHHREWYLHFSDVYRSNIDDTFLIPDYMMAAFEAGEPIEPILDYLLEQYGAERPWLHGAVARACGVAA